jgi:hypothetical protein
MKKLILITLAILAAQAPLAAHGGEPPLTYTVLLAGGPESNEIWIWLTPDGRTYVIDSIYPLEVGGTICEHPAGNLRDQPAADRDLRHIAQELIDTVERDQDIVLAAIFLNQIAGAYAVRHCTEAAIVVCIIARAMRKSAPEVLVVTAAALTMNVGMVRQAETFQSRDCALTSEERAAVRRHPNDSVDMLRWAGITDDEWLDLVLLHHENDDGTGYPQGRLGDEISQNAKLIGLADRYCAFVSARIVRARLVPARFIAARLGALRAARSRPCLVVPRK